MLPKFWLGSTICTKWIISPYRWMEFCTHLWKMGKPSNHQTSSEISDRMGIFKRQLANILAISFQKSWILDNLIISMKNDYFKDLSSGNPNDPFSWISCNISKEGLPAFIVSYWKSWKWLICSQIFYRSLYLSEKWQFQDTACLLFKREVSRGKLTFLQANAVLFIVSPWKLLDFHKNY